MTITRRQALAGIAAGTVAGTVPHAAAAAGAPANPALVSGTLCVLTPQADQGPFYLDPRLMREDITDGRKGVALKLLLQVVKAADCVPISGARIDVWHADTQGTYSGYASPGDKDASRAEGKSFLRGTQLTDGGGLARFTTIYPGWYPGRTPHIHIKVFLTDKMVLTAQLYFPDALSEFIYRNAAPYSARRRERDTTNASDDVLRLSGGGHESFCSIKEEADHYLASLVLGVKDEAATPLDAGMPPPPPGGSEPLPPPRRPRGPLIPGA